MTPMQLPIYVTTCTIYDDRARGDKWRVTYVRHSFTPIPAREEIWADGHCQTVNPAASEPTYLVEVPMGEVVTVLPYVTPRLRVPDSKPEGKLLDIIDVLGMARDQIRGLSLVLVADIPATPRAFEPPPVVVVAPGPVKAVERPRITVEVEPLPKGWRPVKRTQLSMFDEAEMAR